ncbi:MAG TPA: GLPGLI family protein [Sediminibacterium sp.]|nr:GLPGLI family protein [Sediminibacterium sp.]
MKYRHLLICILLLFSALEIAAQDFVTRAKIEFEKKINMRRSLAGQNISQQTKDMLPEFLVSYYDLIFTEGASIYKAGRDNDAANQPVRQMFSQSKSKNIYYTNFATRQVVVKKEIMQEDFLFEDSIPPIKWKIGHEIRKIAGYECRKAIGRIFDSVYLVAFYAEELVVKGGPEGIQGLPGTILGLAIPRYNITWFATKVELADIDETVIVPPTIKGKKSTGEETRTRLFKLFSKTDAKDPAAIANGYLKYKYFLN